MVDSSNNQCSGDAYVGGVCSDSLLTWQECILGPAETAVMVGVMNSSQEKLNTEINNAITALGLFLAFLC